MDRLGEKKIDKYGIEMEIIEYKNCHNIIVRFNDGFGALVKTRYDCFEKNNIKNPYRKSFCGVGYLGQGKYNSVNSRKILDCWQNMLKRCYDKEYQKKNPTYKNCEVCEEWLNFQNFAKWYEENYYEIKGEQIHLDKDILIKGNKTYSPENCIFAPIKINSLFTKREECRGKYPIGVKPNGKGYSSRCRNAYGKEVSLGNFNTPHEAFLIYKLNKELVIQSVAQKYKKLIPNRLYEALINYKVEEDD